MEGKVQHLCFILIQLFLLVLGNKITMKQTYLDSKNTMPNLNGSSIKDNDTVTSILRYGFHKTHECQDFLKAYMCIKECLETGYHVAVSNGLCTCKCYKNRDKEIFLGPRNITKYLVPTTTKPMWASSNSKNFNESEIINTSNESSNDSPTEHTVANEMITNEPEHADHFQETETEYYAPSFAEITASTIAVSGEKNNEGGHVEAQEDEEEHNLNHQNGENNSTTTE